MAQRQSTPRRNPPRKQKNVFTKYEEEDDDDYYFDFSQSPSKQLVKKKDVNDRIKIEQDMTKKEENDDDEIMFEYAQKIESPIDDDKLHMNKNVSFKIEDNNNDDEEESMQIDLFEEQTESSRKLKTIDKTSGDDDDDYEEHGPYATLDYSKERDDGDKIWKSLLIQNQMVDDDGDDNDTNTKEGEGENNNVTDNDYLSSAFDLESTTSTQPKTTTTPTASRNNKKSFLKSKNSYTRRQLIGSNPLYAIHPSRLIANHYNYGLFLSRYHNYRLTEFYSYWSHCSNIFNGNNFRNPGCTTHEQTIYWENELTVLCARAFFMLRGNYLDYCYYSQQEQQSQQKEQSQSQSQSQWSSMFHSQSDDVMMNNNDDGDDKSKKDNKNTGNSPSALFLRLLKIIYKIPPIITSPHHRISAMTLEQIMNKISTRLITTCEDKKKAADKE